jgi:hypothetical protein
MNVPVHLSLNSKRHFELCQSRTFDPAIKHAIALMAQSSYTGNYAKNNPCG